MKGDEKRGGVWSDARNKAVSLKWHATVRSMFTVQNKLLGKSLLCERLLLLQTSPYYVSTRFIEVIFSNLHLREFIENFSILQI